MTRNLKALGLAFVAMLAMGALMASAAHAQATFTYPSGSKFTVEPDGGAGSATGTQKFQTTSGTIDCKGTGHEAAPAGTQATEIEFTGVSYTGCTGPFGETVTLEFNGCSYIATAKTTITTTEITAQTDIKCPAGKQITWTGGFGTCQIHIPAQTTIGGHVIFKNEAGTPTTITGELTLTGIKYQGTGTCTPQAGAADGTWTGNITIKGYVGTHIAANQRSISVS